MAAAEAQRRARDKWLTEKLETINVRVPKGKKALVQAYVARTGETVNGFINRIIDEALAKTDMRTK